MKASRVALSLRLQLQVRVFRNHSLPSYRHAIDNSWRVLEIGFHCTLIVEICHSNIISNKIYRKRQVLSFQSAEFALSLYGMKKKEG